MNQNTSEGKTSFGVNRKKQQQTVISILIALIIIVGALEFTGVTNFSTKFRTVATVNGEKITQQDVNEQIKQVLASPQFQNVDISNPTVREQVEAQILAGIINTRLLLQKATEAGITTTDVIVQAEYDAVVVQLGGEEFMQKELSDSNLTSADFRNNLKEQIIILEYVQQNIDIDGIEATTEEIAVLYEQASNVNRNIPPLSEIRDEIKAQVILEKKRQITADFIESLRAAADIEIVD